MQTAQGPLMTNQVVKTFENGEKLTFSSADFFISEITDITHTRGNRVKVYRELWLTDLETKKEQKITLGESSDGFECTPGQEIRAIYIDWDRGSVEQTVRALGDIADHKNWQAVHNFNTGKTHFYEERFTQVRFPFNFPWIVSAAVAVAVAVFFAASFRIDPNFFTVVTPFLLARGGIVLWKDSKYGDIDGFINEAVTELVAAKPVTAMTE